MEIESTYFSCADPAGPIGAHTPDVCYGGLGYSCKGKPARKGIAFANDGHSSFWTARFEKVSNTEEPLRVYWAWSTNGDWQAASNPRSDFALKGALYKLYVVRSDNPTSAEDRASKPGTVLIFS